MQEAIVESIQQALDSAMSLERRTATFTKMAQTVCERMRQQYKARIWQCIVGTPGQSGFNIACSKDTNYKLVVDGIEFTVFYPKL